MCSVMQKRTFPHRKSEYVLWHLELSDRQISFCVDILRFTGEITLTSKTEWRSLLGRTA